MPQLSELKAEKFRRLCRRDPVLYAETVLRVGWTAAQKEIANALIRHKRVLVKAGHGVGKSMLAGGLVNWFYDCYDPGLVLSTAPTEAQLIDVLWKEVRIQRRGRSGLAPKAARMESSPAHFAAGYTARDASAFQGRHEENVLIIFDEAVGVAGEFWDAAEGMMVSDNCYWLAIMNPTDVGSRAYDEDKSGRWKVFEMSALNHPNVVCELVGEKAPYPGAVRLNWTKDKIEQWCQQVTDRRPGDVEFGGKNYRPGPLFESRVLGKWPSAGTNTVWPETIWEMAMASRPESAGELFVGCDVARYGDDMTVFHVRRGSTSLHHESQNGWGVVQVAARCRELAGDNGQINVDDDGVGGGVVDLLMDGGANVVPVKSGSSAIEKTDYPNKRSELWFNGAQRAANGEIDLSRLPVESIRELRRQAFSVTWKMRPDGKRQVESKDETKSKIGRSPDDMDALNLAYYEPLEKEVFYPLFISTNNFNGEIKH